MELEILFHTLWWFGERLGEGDVIVWGVVCTIPFILVIAIACDLWESKGKQLLRRK